MESIKLNDYIGFVDLFAERRYFNSMLKFAEVETNGTKTMDENTIEGYAAVFNSDSQDFGGWIERIAPGAFTDVMDSEDTLCLMNHDMNMVLGRNKVNVKLVQDEMGLKYQCKMPDTMCANDARNLIKSGIINKSSFAFTVAEENFANGDPSKGIPHIRTIVRIEKLYDVSPVTVPAYQDTSVASRSFKKFEAKKEISKSLLELRLKINLTEQRLKPTQKRWHKKLKV